MAHIVLQRSTKIGEICSFCPSFIVRHVACCPLVSHVEHELCTLLKLEKDRTDRRTDARPLHYAYRWTRPA